MKRRDHPAVSCRHPEHFAFFTQPCPGCGLDGGVAEFFEAEMDAATIIADLKQLDSAMQSTHGEGESYEFTGLCGLPEAAAFEGIREGRLVVISRDRLRLIISLLDRFLDFECD